MVFEINFKGKSFSVREVAIKPKELAFDKIKKDYVYVDKNGDALTKIRNPMANGEKPFVFLDKDNQRYDGSTFKTVNGKPKLDYKKTSVMKEEKLKEVEIKDILATSVTCDHTYYLVNKDFKDLMKELPEGKGLLYLPYVCTSRGFKSYKAVIYYNSLKDRVLMKCVRSDICDIEMPELEVVKEVEADTIAEAVSEDEMVC